MQGVREVDPARWGVYAIIREARREANLTQAELARRSGVSQSQISQYERGLVLPEIATLTRLVEACGMTLDLQLRDGPREEVVSSTALSQSVTERLDANSSWSAFIADLAAEESDEKSA